MVIYTQYKGKPLIVEDVVTFRRNDGPVEWIYVPEVPKRRRSTDVAFLILLAVCSAILLGLLIYSFLYADILRRIYGYDSCGNVCGVLNNPIEGIPCSGKDMRLDTYLMETDYTNRTCVRYCPGKSRNNRCGSSTVLEDISYSFVEDGRSVVYLSVIGLGLSILSLGIFRYFVKQFVWTILIISVLALCGVTGFIWYLYCVAGGNDGILIVAIFLTIFSLVCVILVLVLTESIKLTIFFFKHAIRIVFDMPILVVEPLLTIASNLVVLALFLYTFLLVTTSGRLQKVEDIFPIGEQYYYVPDTVTYIAMGWDIIMVIWMVQFVLACQHLVVAGAVSAYYFARDKTSLVSPIFNSVYNLIRYHLGTVAYGSFLITVITTFKIIIRMFSNSRGWYRLVYLCLRPLEDAIRYLTSMGYIETAIHGQSLCRSSARAINLIVAHALSAIALNSVVNFVCFIAKCLIVGITIGVGFGIQATTASIVFGGIIALLCSHCVFVVFEVAVDTLFLCYCEDQCVNDGVSNPFATTVGLHSEIQKAQMLTVRLQQAKQKKKKQK